jgi:hypothetical protein
MDSCLTQKIPVSLPVWRKYSSAPKIAGYSEITSLTPIIKEFLPNAEGEGQIQADELFARCTQFEGSGECVIETVGKKKKKAYCKVTHLLDPELMLKGYYIKQGKGEERKQKKINNPMNQAYVDGLANYLLGQLHERKISPHFCSFYGGFKGIAETYRFNITDDFESFRLYKDFWNRRRDGLFSLFLDTGDDEPEVTEDIKWITSTPKSSLHSTPFSYVSVSSTRSSLSTQSHISLHDNPLEGTNVELESIHSADDIPIAESVDTEDDDEDEDEDDDDDDEDEIQIYTQFENYPVMLIFQEHMEGTLDGLLEEEFEDKEDRWTAWLFQVIAALCAAQGVLGFTHNDLHTNNIVWCDTEESWLHYRNRAGEVFRVPTYGKIFRIIDFGRAIFRVGEKWFISDDYNKGGDAEGQYNFEQMKEYNPKKKTIYPNPSFDLSRLSVSMLTALFSEQPTELLDGLVLSKEDDWEVKETESKLWNLLWSWLIDDKGGNILCDEDGTERFPDFDLYTHITQNVFNAKPQEQITKDIFKPFLVDVSSSAKADKQPSVKKVGDWETIYPLFC